MALKSQVAKSQQEAVEVREGVLSADELRLRRRGGGGMAAVLHRTNAGVTERDRVDRLEVKVSSDAEDCMRGSTRWLRGKRGFNSAGDLVVSRPAACRPMATG